MTYAPESTLDVAPEAADPTTSQKLNTLKNESFDRAQRIYQILKRAFAESRAEFQAGKTVVSPLAKDVTTEAAQTMKVKSQQVADAFNEAWEAESSAPDRTERMLAVLKSLLSRAQEVVFPWVTTQAKQQSQRLDTVLTDRYGDDYRGIRDRFEGWRDRFNTATVSTEADAPVDDAATQTISVDGEPIQ